MSDGPDADVESVFDAFWSVFSFAYDNAVAVAAISVAWFVASLPLVTFGPATLGVYAAVASVRENGNVDRDAVLATVRGHAIDAVLLGGVVAFVGAVSLLYVGRYVRTESTVAAVLGTTGLYLTIHFSLLLAATFVALAGGVSLSDGVRVSYRWSVTRPAAALATLVLTALLLLASLALTVAFVLVFPALAAWFHTELLEPLFTPEQEPQPAGEARPESASYAGSGKE